MMSAGMASLFFTVVLLVITAYFLLGGLPLLVLQHDTPLDARFIRSFFNLYYRVVTVSAVGALASYAMWGRVGFVLGAAMIILTALTLRRRLIPAMDRIGEQIQASDMAAIRTFRRVHSTALLVNLLQLVGLVWGVTRM